ncbi:MAG TPA: oxidoreductase [Planctomycetaceae bacterium]|nr:oxidoreductase [Planctomycetaceae bacterium]HRE99756.1 SDR family oxidoreductase [Pirellulaceae bacterium]
MSERRWQGRTAVVTGAGRGIGEAIAVALARRGVVVGVNDLADGPDLQRVTEICRQEAGEAVALPFDVADQQSVESGLERFVRQTGRLDFLVPNAAYSDRQLFYEADMAGFRRTIDVTMWGPFFLVRAGAQQMIASKLPGSIVVVSSTHASRPIPGSMAYNMAKAAVEQLVRTAATELVEYRIRVNAVRPGWVDTPGERKFFTEQMLAEIGRKLPMGRLERPDEIADGVLMLLDPEREAINGAVLSVDGGIELPVDQLFRVRRRSAE